MKQMRLRHGNSRSYAFIALVLALATWWMISLCLSSGILCRPVGVMPHDNNAGALLFLKDHVAWSSSESTAASSIASMISPTTRPRSDLWTEWKKFPHAFPCYLGSTQLMVTEPASEGILFQRPMKVGSTTMVGVVLRLAHNRSPWLDPDNIKCQHRSMHGTALEYEYGQRDPTRSFLFSLVRDPTQRAISEFFHFAVSTSAVVPTDEKFRAYLRTETFDNFYLNELKTQNYTSAFAQDELDEMFYKSRGINEDQYNRVMEEGTLEESMMLYRDWQDFSQHGPNVTHAQVVQDILSSYNLILVTERMDESLLVMQMLLNLTTREILYTRARSSGAFSVGRRSPCLYIFKSFLTPGMKDYFESEEWKFTIRGDQLLYDAVNESLDRTIDALGRDMFEQKLSEYRVLLAKAQEHCRGRVKPLCSEGGERRDYNETTCYIWGEGCDNDCLADFVF